MGKTYTCTIPLKCWKVHKCSACEGTYRYRFERTIKGSAGSEAAARKNAEKSLQRQLESGVDQQPCPQCGLFQANMVGGRRSVLHGRVTVVFAIAIIIVAIIGAAHGLPFDRVSTIAAGIAAAGLLIHLAIAARSPNRNRDANRALAQRRVEQGTVQQLETGSATESFESQTAAQLTGKHQIALLLLALGCVALFGPELERRAKGQALNADFYPPVVGPGDEPTVYMNESVTAVDGRWRGSGGATVLNADKAGVSTDTLDGRSRDSDWGSTISTKTKTNSVTPWIVLQVPDDAKLTGKTLDLDVYLHLTYPKLTGDKQFLDADGEFRRHTTLSLSDAHAGATYYSRWWAGMIAGGLLGIIGGWWLARLAKAHTATAHPVGVMPIEVTG
jgi:hypothetical protein